jgi:peptidoglycan/LPS O-acetylase OafA/YrhL
MTVVSGSTPGALASPARIDLVAVDPTHRRSDIQGLRALAVSLVVLYHAGVGPPGGFVGVDIFFVVSGFVITGMLSRELSRTGRISMRRFYLRRARRLLPALALMSVATLAMTATLLSPLGPGQKFAGQAGSAATTFVANAYFFLTTGGYFRPVAGTNPFLHTWSLSVEEQFYLAFPVLLLLAWRLRPGRAYRRVVAVMLLGLGMSLVAGVVFTYGWVPSVPLLRSLAVPDIALRFAFFSSLTRAWEFLAGVVVALVLARLVLAPRTAGRLAFVGVALLVASTVVIHADDAFPGVLAALPVTGTACLLMAGTGVANPAVTRVLSTRPAVALGNVSYSWYLWHWPIILLAKVWFPDAGWVGLVAGVGSLVPAIGSYLWVERPIHSGQRLTARRATVVLVVTCLTLPLAAGTALVSASAHAWGRADLAAVERDILPPHADELTHCSSSQPLTSPVRPACLWPTPNAHRTVLLIGDSNAGHLVEPMIGAAHERGFNLEVATMNGCPLLRRETYLSDACQRFVEGSLSTIATRVPAYSAVVISNSSVGYVQGSLIRDIGGTSQPDNLGGAYPAPITDASHRRAVAQWARDLQRTATQVTARSPVVVVGAVPQFAGFPQCLAPSVFQHPATGCGVIAAEENRLLRRSALIEAERLALTGLPSAYVDTGDRLCTVSAGCRVWANGHLVFRDATHLSVDGSLIFQPDLGGALDLLTAPPSSDHP